MATATYPLPMSDESEPLNFETALAELEDIVERMETGALSLEESLQSFERGIQLTRRCQSALEQAELRVKTLMNDGTEAVITDDNDDT